MKWMLILLIFPLSCTVLGDYKKTDFQYYEEDRKENLSFKVPAGFQETKSVLDTSGGKEQFYYYKFGSLFYVARNLTWPTENEPFILSKYPQADRMNTFRGKDKDGLYWKEIRMEGFRVGYSYVPEKELERFERAILSFRF